MALVALAIRGRYLRAVDGVVRADAETLEPTSLLTRVRLGHDRIALRTLDGCFLAITPDDHMSFTLTTVPELIPDAAFEEILWPDGHVSLRSARLTYVTAHLDGSIVANRTLTAVGERFTFVPVPARLLPVQVRRRVTEPAKVLPSVR